MWKDPVAENGTRPEPAATETGTVLAGLTAAGVPWLTLAAAEGGRPDPGLTSGGDTAVIDITDPQSPPVTLNPLEPETGYPVQAHADRLAGLIEAAFGLTDPVAAALRSGLRRAYAECGWDLLTGLAPPGGRTPPAVPVFGHLGRAVLAAADDLGYDPALRATVRGFLQARLEPLWTGPAGRFLEGGHPVDSAALLAGNTLFIIGGPADDEALSFLAGVPLIRLAERLSLADGSYPARARRLCPDHQSGGPGPRLAVVLAGPLARPAQPQAAAWLTRLLADLRARGVQVIATPAADHPAPPAPPSAAPPAPPASPSAADIPARLLNGRRSAACGALCRRSSPCTGYQIHAASLLARGDEQVWLRLWLHTLLLAFLTGRPVPRVPPGLRSAWRALGPRERDCLLATVLEAAVSGRAGVLRRSYDPQRLLVVLAAVSGRILETAAAWPGPATGEAGETEASLTRAQGPDFAPPFRAGQVWVIPQLRWLHEAERLNPLGQAEIRLDDLAPPLDFGLAGLPDWPGIRVRHRLAALRRHALSMESPRNREAAWTALLGADGRAGLDADLASAAIGIGPQARLNHVARAMGIGARGAEPGWLEVVLSWPDRIIGQGLDPDLPQTATG
jgi:hypothetical protein